MEAKNKMKGNEYSYNCGGLIRCCIHTLENDTNERKNGDIIECKYCQSRIELIENKWVWKPVNQKCDLKAWFAKWEGQFGRKRCGGKHNERK